MKNLARKYFLHAIFYSGHTLAFIRSVAGGFTRGCCRLARRWRYRYRAIYLSKPGEHGVQIFFHKAWVPIVNLAKPEKIPFSVSKRTNASAASSLGWTNSETGYSMAVEYHFETISSHGVVLPPAAQTIRLLWGPRYIVRLFALLDLDWSARAAGCGEPATCPDAASVRQREERYKIIVSELFEPRKGTRTHASAFFR